MCSTPYAGSEAHRAPFGPTKVLNSLAERLTAGPIGCGVDLKLIAAGKPTQNAYIESFNGKFRDECLNDHYFNNLCHARAVIAEWRRDYNEAPPHSSLGRIPPAEFAARYRLRSTTATEQKIV